MKHKHDYNSIEITDMCPGHCLWCETDFFAASPGKVKMHVYRVYPVYQWLIHKNYADNATEDMQHDNFRFVEDKFMDKFIPEYEMLRFKFFQCHPYQQDMVFEVPDDPGRIYKNKSLRAYLDQYDENTQRDIYEIWCNIEAKLYKIFYD